MRRRHPCLVIAILIGVALISGAGAVDAGVLEPELEAVLASASPGDEIDVIIELADRIDPGSLSFPTKSARRAGVVSALRARAIVLPKGLEFTFPELPEKNYIDRLIHEKLRKLRMVPSEIASDEVFLRRATIDITGTLPTEEEYRKFLANSEPDKRERLVDELLSRKEFVELWVLKWAELLQIRTSEQVSYKAA